MERSLNLENGAPVFRNLFCDPTWRGVRPPDHSGEMAAVTSTININVDYNAEKGLRDPGVLSSAEV